MTAVGSMIPRYRNTEGCPRCRPIGMSTTVTIHAWTCRNRLRVELSRNGEGRNELARDQAQFEDQMCRAIGQELEGNLWQLTSSGRVTTGSL